MGIIEQLINRVSGKKSYPITVADAVFDGDISQRTINEQLKTGVGRRPTVNEVTNKITEMIAGKQNAIETSNGLQMTDGNILSLTDRAKQMLFDDVWTTAWGAEGAVDHSHVDDDGRVTPYMGNTVWMTYEEALEVYSAGTIRHDTYGFYSYKKIRTNMPPNQMWIAPNLQLTFVQCSKIEVANVGRSGASLSTAVFGSCGALHTIIGKLTVGSDAGAFTTAYALRDMQLTVNNTCNLSKCRHLSLSTVTYMAENSKAGAVITVHAEVYDKLTDEDNAEWHAVLETAQERNVTFATSTN